MSVRVRFLAMMLIPAAMLASVSLAAESQATVNFAPAVAMASYGESERTTLEAAVDAALARATRKAPLPAGVSIQVTFEQLAPSHPTHAQQMADPAVDPIRTHFLGGAELVGVVRDASGHVLTTVKYSHFPPTLRLGSVSLDPWADARLAIDQFAVKLAAACRDLKRG